MPHGTKIATCCYCGTRAALVLKGSVRHELACSACGAPLHHLKMLRSDTVGDRELRPRPKPARPMQAAYSDRPVKPKKNKPRKRRKGLVAKIFEEAFDVIEDIFD